MRAQRYAFGFLCLLLAGCGHSSGSGGAGVTQYLIESSWEGGSGTILVDPSQLFASYGVTIPSGAKAAVVVASATGVSGSDPSVTDTQGNAFAKVLGPVTSGGGLTSYLFVAPITIGSGTSDDVTVHWSSGTPTSTVATIVAGLPVSAAQAVDGNAQITGSGASITCGGTTTSVANDVLLAFAVTGTAQNTFTGASGYTLDLPNSGEQQDSALEHQRFGAAGTYQPTFTSQVSGNWSCLTVALKTQ